VGDYAIGILIGAVMALVAVFGVLWLFPRKPEPEPEPEPQAEKCRYVQQGFFRVWKCVCIIPPDRVCIEHSCTEPLAPKVG